MCAARKTTIKKEAIVSQDGKIKLYVKGTCAICRKVREHLHLRGVDFELLDIKMPANWKALVAEGGPKKTPLLSTDEGLFFGLDEIMAYADEHATT